MAFGPITCAAQVAAMVNTRFRPDTVFYIFPSARVAAAVNNWYRSFACDAPKMPRRMNLTTTAADLYGYMFSFLIAGNDVRSILCFDPLFSSATTFFAGALQ